MAEASRWNKLGKPIAFNGSNDIYEKSSEEEG